MVGPESRAAGRLARSLYRDAPLRIRLQQRFRAVVCSFDPLLPEIRSQGGRLLDFGCGAGLLAFHCVVNGYVDTAEGVDVAPNVIEVAAAVATSLPEADRLRFQVGEAPDGEYDAITMIDVMHHVPPTGQRAAFAGLATRLAPGGILVYKDIGRHPRWRAAANRLHDLVLNRQWVRYVPIESVIEWAVIDHGLDVIRQGTFNQLVYGHELAVFRKPAGPLMPPPE